MTLQQLEYIIALDNYRHFVRAAESCFVTQPTLTMQVKKLEAEIGVKLFDRNKKPLEPTRAGEKILLKARQILREVDQLKAFVTDETESLEGDFTLGVIPTLAPYVLPLFLPAFVAEHPKTRLRIRELQTEQIIAELNKGTLDLGLLVTPLEVKSIREVPLFYEPFLCYLPEDHALVNQEKLSPEDLNVEDMLVLEEGHCFREQALSLCSKRAPTSNFGFEYASGSIETLKGLVEHGIGYTLVPELSVAGSPDSPWIRRFQEPEPVREVSLVVHNSFSKEALLEHLRDAVQASIPDRFQKTRSFMRVKWR